jgi:hypothetical protein
VAQFGPPPAKPDPCGDAQQEATGCVGVYSNVDGLLDVARGFLNTAPEDRSGEDRTLVVVQVSVENLAGNVPAGTPAPAEFGGSVSAETSTTPECDGNVLAVTPAAAVCHIAGVGWSSRPRRNGMPATVRCLAR